MRRVTFVYAYYDNPSMLALQYATWHTYSEWCKRRIEIVVVDDASPRWPAIDVARPSGLPSLSIYRVRDDMPWHQDGARNLGCHVARDGWLFMSDMDHVLPDRSLLRMLKLHDDSAFYTFARMDAATGKHMVDAHGRLKPHPNTYAMRRDLYWRAGGYDEDFCGVYGTDGAFRRQLLQVGNHVHLGNVSIVRWPRSMVSDASTTTLDRKTYGGDARKREARERKIARGREGVITTLDFEWDKVL